ncbi:MAG: alpha/beta hydrolase [Thermomicrobiales bacterium]
MHPDDWSIAATPDVEIAYHEAGAAVGVPFILLHGFPYDPLSYEEVSRLLAGPEARVIVPALRGFGRTRLRPGVMRSGQQAAIGADVVALMDALGIERAVLAGYDWGGRAACVTAALHPERVLGLVSVDGYNIQNIAHGEDPVGAAREKAKWYQHYFQTPAGVAGLEQNREDIARLLWRDWSPSWPDIDAAFARSAPSLHNPDFVEVVIHSYRHRRGAAPGDPQYDAAERALAAQPVIVAPTIAITGVDDGIPLGDAADDAPHFRGPYEVRDFPGVGHNPPQEDPARFTDALRDVGGGAALRG